MNTEYLRNASFAMGAIRVQIVVTKSVQAKFEGFVTKCVILIVADVTMLAIKY